MTWNADAEKVDVPNLDQNSDVLSEIFRTKSVSAKSFCGVTNLPLFVFNDEMKNCMQNYFKW